ncbi:RICIN domain-containing protein [Streptomyces longispororuber]|uniref:RICIN domain-containing protein n=1 Tax=Streptomyces longispororuber TaxID=68230 RepID=UPI00210A8418|nr:RICIN domain-containing protein [Streptomyces longispororuber]MCQ4214153.1 RICIN domain-containing protein [Streptomyces longispororuber]
MSASKNCMEPTAAGVREASCDGGAGQVWELLYTQGEDGGQLVRLRNKGTGECLASPGTSEDGGAVTPEVCEAAADGQLWRISTDTQGHHMTFQLPAANLRLGLNDWHQAGEGKPHDATIGTTHNYYGSPSLYFDYEGTAPA